MMQVHFLAQVSFVPNKTVLLYWDILAHVYLSYAELWISIDSGKVALKTTNT